MMQALDFDRIVRVKVIFLTICCILPEIIWNQSVFCLYLQRAFDKFEIRIENNKYKSIRRKKAKMADDLGSIAWSFLPENVQVQYLQKIALRAENPSGPKM